MMKHKRSPVTIEQASLTSLTPKRLKADISISSKVLPLSSLRVWHVSCPYGKFAFQQVLNFIATSMRKQDVSLTCFLLRRILKNRELIFLQVKLIFPQGPPHVNDKWVPQYSCREIVKISILHVDVNTSLYLSYVFWRILHNSSLGKCNDAIVIQEL